MSMYPSLWPPDEDERAATTESAGAAAQRDVNALEASVWPSTARRIAGALHIGGLSVTELAAEYGTPSFLLDEYDLRERARSYADLDGVQAYYAGKAFLATAVVRYVTEEGLGVDVCSSGELAVALAAGCPPSRICMHGNNKSVAELERAVQAGVGHIVVDSFDEIARLDRIAQRLDVVQRVLVRVAVGITAHTHEYIATAHEDQKFGFALRDATAEKAVLQVVAAQGLYFAGIHSHIGSQLLDSAGFEVAAKRVVEFAVALKRRHGLAVDELNLGGGMGIAYVAGDRPDTPKRVVARLREIVERECYASAMAVPRIFVEPGRAICGPSTITVYEVGTIKEVSLRGGGTRRYVSVDGGMSDNIRTALYDAKYTCVLANRLSTAEPHVSRVVGKHCESGDVLVRDVWLPGDVRAGDLLAVAATGAYCRSMANNYNHITRPPVIGVHGGATTVILRRETEADLLRLDPGFEAADRLVPGLSGA